MVNDHPGFLRVWDPEAITAIGARYDRWYAPLADSIVTIDPEAVVLGYTWIDESATPDRARYSVRSQIKTTAAGHALAVALRRGLADGSHRLHFVGHSHGAKVVTVAAVLQETAPDHVTLLDSPENLVPVLGGALNDLSGYLRTLPIGQGDGKTFVDNYPSKYGIRYGEEAGLGAIVDCLLDPEGFPLDGSPSPHSYPHLWYRGSAAMPERGVGFAWSPMLSDPAVPEQTQLRQHRTNPDTDPDPWRLEPAPYIRTGGVTHQLVTRAVAEAPLLLNTEDRSTIRGAGWRRQGDQFVLLPIHWWSGPDDATLIIKVNGIERYRSVKGWEDQPQRRALIPIGAMRSGPFTYQLGLEAEGAAEVEVNARSVRSMEMPARAELRSWYRTLGAAAVLALGAFGFRRLSRSLRA